jgi:hypothetical protein
MSEVSRLKPDVIVRIEDVAPHYCAWGIRRWFKANGLDLREFMEKGLPASVVMATGDQLAIDIVDRKINGKQ